MQEAALNEAPVDEAPVDEAPAEVVWANYRAASMRCQFAPPPAPTFGLKPASLLAR